MGVEGGKMKKNINNYFLLIDIFMIFTIYLFVESLTREFKFAMVTNISLLLLFTMITLGKVIVNHFFKLYIRLWSHASIEDFVFLGYSFLISNSVVFTLVVTDLINFTLLKLLAVMFLEAGGYVVTRFGFRYYGYFKSKRIKGLKKGLIIGAGAAGDLVFREVSRNAIAYDLEIVAFLDDNEKKIGRSFKNKNVVGPFDDIEKIINANGIDEVIIAIPSLSRGDLAKMINRLSSLNVSVKTLPNIKEIKDVKDLKIREVQIEDLLGRDEIKLDDNGISGFIKDKIIMVTGGGGSIGSEIVKQVIRYGARKVIIFDIYENNAYDLQQELILDGLGGLIEVLIGSVQDKERINEVMAIHKPDLIFHAAAHKHVPLMEDSPKEAVKNNCYGTYNTALAAINNNVSKFVLISTDKAVNPTNIMGASKRFAELVIQTMDGKSSTKFSAVRFGNVLGSNGSVIPLFKRQIENGGPVTVTHKDIIRYFMTIPEAVQLVLQTGVYAQGGEIFVLDMGQPVKILDLAEKMISLSGYVPYNDIPIEFTGLRPGEKMYEELLIDESQIRTSNERIFVEKNGKMPIDVDELIKDIDSVFEVVSKIIG